MCGKCKVAIAEKECIHFQIISSVTFAYIHSKRKQDIRNINIVHLGIWKEKETFIYIMKHGHFQQTCAEMRKCTNLQT